MTLTLFIGNKNLSSWSFRPWILLKHFDIPFAEEMIRLDEPESRATIKQHSPSGLVPCLKDGDTVVWDSLAIAEYLNDKFPEKGMWPKELSARAMARCMTAEMHSGFSTLRNVWGMEIMARDLHVSIPFGVRKDLGRIFTLWSSAREKYGKGGDFLYGDFSIADAFFAPVVSRIKTYGPVEMPSVISDYMDAMWTLPAYAHWVAGAAKEVEEGWCPHAPLY